MFSLLICENFSLKFSNENKKHFKMGNKNGKKIVPQKLSSKDIKALAKSSGLSEEEIVSLFDMFRANNPDDRLNKEEFAKIYQTLRKEPVANLDEITDFCFRGFDLDNSGCLTFCEFAIGYGITTSGKPEEKLAYAFEIYDAENNGYLCSREVRDGLTAMLDLIGANRRQINITALVNECMSQLDINSDDRICKNEFIEGLMKSYNLRVLMSPFN
jgi:Ca2+-binding EF-hand superfamily protein